MFEYREEYIENQDLIETINLFGNDRWEVFQIEKYTLERTSYGDKWVENHYTIYMKRVRRAKPNENK